MIKLYSNSYTMDCPPVRGDNPRALASGLSIVQVDNHRKIFYFVLLLYVPSQQLWPWRDGQFT